MVRNQVRAQLFERLGRGVGILLQAAFVPIIVSVLQSLEDYRLAARMLAQVVGYDQDEFARRLYYDRQIEASIDAFKAARRTTAEILERMTEAEWAREGTHSEHGRYTIPRWLEIYASHAHKHAEQIRVARGSARKK